MHIRKCKITSPLVISMHMEQFAPTTRPKWAHTSCLAAEVACEDARPAAAFLTSQAEPRFVKVHKSRTSAKQSKQSTRRDLLTELGNKPTPTAKVGGRGSAKKDGAQLRRSSPELFGRC
jgi:hypothetical protein